MSKAIFITARVGSTRLPKKHLLRIQNRHCIEHVFDRAKKSKNADMIVLCTTTLEEDDILVALAERNGIQYFRGSVEDKLERWNAACEKFDVECFVTYDADDLLCEPELIDLAFEQYDRNQSDFIDWELCDLICGSFTYLISSSALRKVCEVKNTTDTEMCWEYFTKTNLFNVEKLENIPDLFKRPEIRLTLDYAEDFHLFAFLFDFFYKTKKMNFNLRDALKLIDENPELILINQYRHKEWKQNQLDKKKLELKNA